MKIRKAAKEDLNDIVRLLRENDLPYENITNLLGCLFIAYTDFGNVGNAGLEILGRHALLRSLVIEEEFRGNGYGTELCHKLIGWGRAKRVEEVYLLTTTAENFFKRIGFERIDRKAAPQTIQKTKEFSNQCPQSAICMMRVC